MPGLGFPLREPADGASRAPPRPAPTSASPEIRRSPSRCVRNVSLLLEISLSVGNLFTIGNLSFRWELLFTIYNFSLQLGISSVRWELLLDPSANLTRGLLRGTGVKSWTRCHSRSVPSWPRG